MLVTGRSPIADAQGDPEVSSFEWLTKAEEGLSRV
jgi:hypothetical protein